MKDNCEKCGWPMTITAGGDEMHCGRKYYHNDYAFCLEKQNDKAQQELNAANARIKRLEDLGKELRECASMIGTYHSNEIETIDQAEAAVEAWDKEAKL